MLNNVESSTFYWETIEITIVDRYVVRDAYFYTFELCTIALQFTNYIPNVSTIILVVFLSGKHEMCKNCTLKAVSAH